MKWKLKTMKKKSKSLVKYIKDEFVGWKTWEVVWVMLACSVICGLSIYWNDTLMGIIAATTGVACVVCTGKGKLSAYIFGAINTLLYAIIAYNAKFYGEVMLNALYYFPLQFYGFYVWSQNMNEETKEVYKKTNEPQGEMFPCWCCNRDDDSIRIYSQIDRRSTSVY